MLAASVKQYLNAIKAKQSALNVRKTLVDALLSALRARTSALQGSGLAPIGIRHLLLSNFTTGDTSEEAS